MLTGAKNQIKVMFLSIKYNLMKEMLNKFSFISNILFMILNNAAFIVEWIIIFSLRDSVGGYTMKDILLIWGIASSTFGICHFFFYGSTELSSYIIDGKLDAYLVQPKNVLLQALTSKISTSALGDILYGYIMLCLYGITITRFFLFTVVVILGGITMTSVFVILHSLSFFITNGDLIYDAGSRVLVNFATYPDTIYKKGIKFILYTIIPVGLTTFIPAKLIMSFDIRLFLILVIFVSLGVALAFLIFYKGLRRYSSSNLMGARI